MSAKDFIFSTLKHTDPYRARVCKKAIRYFFTCEAIHGVIIGGWLIECRKLSLYANKSRDEYVVYFFGDVHVHCVLAFFGNDVITLESRPLIFMYSISSETNRRIRYKK